MVCGFMGSKFKWTSGEYFRRYMDICIRYMEFESNDNNLHIKLMFKLQFSESNFLIYKLNYKKKCFQPNIGVIKNIDL